MSWWSLLLAWLGDLFGERAGAASQRASDVEKANVADQQIVQAEDHAPGDRAALIGRLLDPDGKI